jgi:hypothetical protein
VVEAQSTGGQDSLTRRVSGGGLWRLRGAVARLTPQPVYLAHFLFASIVALLTFRIILTGQGYPIPAIPYTGFSHQVTLSSNFPLAYRLPLGFEDSTTWIPQLPLILPLLWPNTIVGIKAFYLWVFSIYYILCFLVSRLFYVTFVKDTRVNYNSFTLIAAVLFTFNYPFLWVLTSASLPFLLGIPIVTYLLVKWIRMVRGQDGRWLDYVKVGLAMGFLGLADPRFYIWTLIGLVAFLFSYGLANGRMGRIIRLLAGTSFLALPFAVLMLFSYTFGSTSLTYVSGRPLDYSTIAGFSTAYSLPQYFQFQAMTWPGFISASPLVLLLSRVGVQSAATLGYPPSQLLLPGIVSILWATATMGTMALALSAFLFRSSKDHVLHGLGFLTLLAISIGAYLQIRPLIDAYVAAGQIPFVGGIFSITFAIPNYGLIVVDSYALFFSMFTIAELLRLGPGSRARHKTAANLRPRRGHLPTVVRRALPLGVVAILIFANWQLVVGPFYPGQYTPVLPGNGVALSGDFQPATPPPAWEAAYNFFSANDNGSYAVAWTQPYGFAYNWSQRVTDFVDPGVSPNQSFYSYLTSIVSFNYYYETFPLMGTFGVRYFVIDNTSLSSMSPLPDITLRSLQAFFERSPGLVRITTYAPYLMVFEDPGASLFRYMEAPMLVPLPSPGPLFTGYAFHSALNQTPALLPPSSTDQGYTLRQAHDNISQSTYLLYPYNSIYGGYPVHFYASGQMDYSPSQGVLPLGSNWYFEGFGGNLTYGSKAGNMTVSAATARPVSADLSYGDFVSPGHVGIPIPNGTGVNITWRFAYESGNPEGSVSTSVFANNDSWQTIGGSEVFSATLPPALNWRFVTETVTVPSGLYSFDVLWQAAGIKWFNVSDISVSTTNFEDYPSGPYVVLPPFQSEPVPARNSSYGATFSTSLNNTTYSPSQGVLPLGSNWYFEGFGGNLTYGSKAGNMTVSAATARPVSADLSYGDFVSPGHVGIPIPNGTGVNITWRFAYESGNPEGSVSTSVFANNDSWQTIGGSEVFSATLPPAQKFMLVNESVVMTPGYHSFDVIFQTNNVNNVTINSVNITYSLFTEKSVPVVVKIPIWSEAGGAYSFTFALAGTGSLNLGTEALNVSASNGTELERGVTLSPGRPISVALRDLSVSYLLVVPVSVSNRSSLPDSNAFGAYDPISGTITLSPPQRNSTLVIALYGWELDGVSPIAVSVTGQTLYQVVGGAPLTAHVAGAFVLNLAQIIGAALLYAGIVIAFGLFLRPHPLARGKPRLGNRASP